MNLTFNFWNQTFVWQFMHLVSANITLVVVQGLLAHFRILSHSHRVTALGSHWCRLCFALKQLLEHNYGSHNFCIDLVIQTSQIQRQMAVNLLLVQIFPTSEQLCGELFLYLFVMNGSSDCFVPLIFIWSAMCSIFSMITQSCLLILISIFLSKFWEEQ